MSKTLRIVALILVALAALAAAVSWWLRPMVQTAVVKRGRVVDAIPAAVMVRADHLMELRSEAAGRVQQSSLALGKALNDGDEVLRLDAADLQLELEALRRNRENALRRAEVGFVVETQLATARENLAKAERAEKSGGVAPMELAQQRRTVQQLEQQLALEKLARQAELDALETSLKAKQRDLERMRVTASVAGEVVEVLARPGDLVAAGAVVARVLSATRVVEAKIAEENFASVRIGQAATVRFLSYGAEQFAAKVAAVLPMADAETRRYTAQLAVEIAPERLVPGLSGEALIVVGSRENVLVVPRRAVVGDRVMTVEEGRVRARKIARGFSNLTEVQILDGVKEGDVVIVENPESFRDGERVRVKAH